MRLPALSPAAQLRRTTRWLAAATLAAGCSSAPPKPEQKLNRWGRPVPKADASSIPDWVKRPPYSSKARVVAVGRSGPTFWPQDGLNNAQEDARGRLALALAAHIEQLHRSKQTAHGTESFDLTKEAIDLVINNSRIEATWVDEAGLTDEPGTVLALASVDLQASQASARGKSAARAGVPSWVDGLPSATGRAYAAGYSGPTFRPDDALQYAQDAAIDNLARTLRSRVEAYALLVQTSTGQSIDDFARAEDPDKKFREIVAQKAKFESTWIDKVGARPGDPPGAVWVLASIDVQSKQGSYSEVEDEDVGPALGKTGEVEAPAAKDAATK